MPIDLMIWSIGLVAALGNAWLMDRRDRRDRADAVDEIRRQCQANDIDMMRRLDVLENKVDAILRRIDQ